MLKVRLLHKELHKHNVVPKQRVRESTADLNTVRLTVHGLAEVLAPFGCELVEPPATHQEPLDKLRANGILPSEQHWL